MTASQKVFTSVVLLVWSLFSEAGASDAAAATSPLMRSEEPSATERTIHRHGDVSVAQPVGSAAAERPAGEPPAGTQQWRRPEVHEVMAHVQETDPLLHHVLEGVGAYMAVNEHGEVHLHRHPEEGEEPPSSVHVPYLEDAHDHELDGLAASLLEPEADTDVMDDDQYAAVMGAEMKEAFKHMSSADRMKLMTAAMKNLNLMCPDPIVKNCGRSAEPVPPDTGQNCASTSGGCPEHCRCCLPYQDEECPEETSLKGKRFYKCVTDWRLNACTTDGSKQCRFDMLCKKDLDCKPGCVCCRLPGVCPEGPPKCYGMSGLAVIKAARRIALAFGVSPQTAAVLGVTLQEMQKMAEASKGLLDKGLEMIKGFLPFDLPFFAEMNESTA